MFKMGKKGRQSGPGEKGTDANSIKITLYVNPLTHLFDRLQRIL